MDNSKCSRIRKKFCSPATPKSVMICFSPRSLKVLTESKTQDNPHLQTDPFSELRITNHEKLKPVFVKHSKKFSTGETINPNFLKLPESFIRDSKKNSVRANIVLPKIQKEQLFTPRTLTHSNSVVANRPLFDKRINMKTIGKVKNYSNRVIKKTSIDETILEVSFGN